MAAYSFLGSQRAKIYRVIFGTETRGGRLFDLVLISFIMISVLLIIAESYGDLSTDVRNSLHRAEIFFTLIFTVEYVLRIFVSPKPAKYMRSFFGVVDLLSILPVYLTFLFPSASYLLVVRFIRVLRIFRVLKLVRYMREARYLLVTLRASGRKISVFFFFVFVLATIFGSLIFVIEGPENGFTSIPHSIYWAVITITTVGYGDVVPHTPLGKAIAAMVTLIGYAVIAVPTGIITAEISLGRGVDLPITECEECGAVNHQAGSRYCRLCGRKLPVLQQSVHEMRSEEE